jgi:hypothetical protein
MYVSGMPTYPYLYADDLVAVLKQKHAAGTYKSMVTQPQIPVANVSTSNDYRTMKTK